MVYLCWNEKLSMRGIHMAKRLDLVGQRFGYLVVIGRAENNNRGNTQWLCQCDCGKKKVVLGYDLTHGRTTTCGCKANMKGKESYNRKNLVGLKFGTLSVISVSKIDLIVFDIVHS